MNYPEDLLYTKDHEWVRFEGNIATVGITHFAQSELGDVVYVEVETVGESFDHHETFGSIEAVKTVSDLFTPVAGTVIEFNEALEDDPEIVNQDCYTEGWLIKMEVADDVDKSHLMSSAVYQSEVLA
ncbi:MAG: glycine cleavage system protein GcvH [Bacteroidota bacterium]